MNVEEDRSCPRDDSPVGSVSSFSEICSDDQNVLRSSCNHAQSPEISSDRQHSCSKLSPQKDAGSDHSVNGDGLAGKLSVALADIRAKEDMVEQHARVTEEAVAGWEKAELEVANLKQELESSALKNLVLEDKLEHLDGALKGCVRQLCQAREEQEENIHVAVINKTRHWDYERLKLENQLSEVKSLLEFTQAEASASSMANHDFEEKLIAMQKENSDLRLKLQSMSEQLKVQTLEREFSIQTAETVSRQHLESIKKICKLETECRRLQIMCRKSRECNSDQKSLRNSTYMESLTDSQSDNGERMIALGSDTSLSDSWASALIMDLDQCKSDKKANKKILDSSSLDLNLMDDFLEMEKLAAMPETQHTTISPRNDLGSSSDAVSENSPSKGEHELAVRRIAVLEQTVERMEIERAELEIILADTQEKLEISCNHVVSKLNSGNMNHHDSNNRLQYVVALLTTTIIVPTFLQSSVNIVKLASAEDATKSSVPIRVPIGVILDLENESGKVWNTTISMAIEDFYTSHTDYKTRLALNIRDSKKDVSADATSIVLDLLNNVEVKSIIQPIASAIVSELGGKAQVPVISFSAMNPSLSHANAPYFIRTGLDDSSQTNAIADIVTHFGWREVVPIYEDSEYGHKIIPFLYEALSSIDAKISYRGKGILSPTATDNQISSILDVLKLNEARVFVVHVRPSLGWRLFKKVDEIGMMEEGYVWIITDEMTSALGSVDPTIVPLDSMQGVLGVKTYIHEFESLQNFMHRWKAMLGKENLISSEILRAYDMVCAIAIALEKIGSMTSEMEMLKKSSIGSRLLDAILTTEFSGIIGKFHLIDGQLPPFPYQVVNLNGLFPGRVVGFWKPGFGLSRRLSGNGGVDVLGPVIWPGEPKVQPDGRRRNLLWKEGSIKSRQINVTVPMKDGFNEFVKVVSFDPITKEANVSGFSIDVFREAIKNVGLEIDKYYAFEINETNTYDDMCEKIKIINGR